MNPAPARGWRPRVEYAFEALGLGLFMISACAFGAALEYPGSPLHDALPDALARRVLMGLGMGGTAVALIYSPFGRRSGAHLNPATTLAFWSLGRVRGGDAIAYAVAQICGGLLGVGLAAWALGPALRHPAVDFVVTRPGPAGPAVAFLAEVAISFVLIGVVLRFVAHPRLMRWAGVAAGTLVMAWIILEAPLSGMSMNPARSLGSAAWAGQAPDQWIYWTAPPLGMVLAAALFRATRGRDAGCAKLDHAPQTPCLFCGAPGAVRARGTFAAPAPLETGSRPH